ncbi:28 kDa heat- and acid-stable phosphoprotein [Patella vulgata]|uniref:28 kDa heat- and acid-stable phosphoprotein n=1 Tax=Patella vulgata TaxID=6465 RepID=UPI00217F65E2|nr:28 kDa heat- and acid-stable phosphoprotein [Patella vulgata]
MPRGGLRDSRGKKSKKGQRRHFTDEEALKNEEQKLEREKNWRRQQGEGESDEEEGAGATSSRKKDGSGSSSSSDSSSDEEEEKKSKGVEGFIEVANPNRSVKQAKKVTDIDTGHKTVLSRREREELEKTEAKKKYDQLHMEGKTTEAQADLARLALIRKQREEQAKKRDEERKELENKKKQVASSKGKS